jgi:signal transduction protein with GAF and PtsI domain
MNSNKTLPERLRFPIFAVIIAISIGLAAVLWALGFMSLPQVATLGGVLILIGLLLVEFFYRIAASGWRESQQRHRGLVALRKSILSVSSSLNLDEVLQSILACTLELARVKMINIMLIDPEARTLIMRAHIGQPPDWAKAVQRNPIPVGKSLTGWVAEKGEVLQIEDAASDPRLLFADFARRYGLSSYLGIPLKFRNRVIGVLNLHASEPRRFAADEIEVLSTLADHAAVALENARLYEEIRQRVGELEEKHRQLIATQEELIKAQRLAAIGELGLAVAHEINNPLATLLLQLDFISRQSQNLPPELQTSLKIMERMIWRMKKVVDSLQDIQSEEVSEVAEGLKMVDLRAEAGLFE